MGSPEKADGPDDPGAKLRALVASRLFRTLLLLVGVGLVFWVNVGGYGALASPLSLAGEVHSTQEAPLSWTQGDDAPYCYRWLFRALVLGASRALGVTTSEGFYVVFVAAGMASFALAGLFLERFLRATGASPGRAGLGLALFFTSFPALFAYDMPVHTREDALAYAGVALLLWLVALDRPLALALVGALAANVRETTTLGLLPYLFVAARPLATRVAVVAPAFATIALVHVLRAPPVAAHGYLLEGVHQNLAQPTEALLYLGASFGALWLLAALRLLEKRAAGDSSGPWGWRASALAIGLALASNALLGMLREDRIVFVAAPFVVKLAVEYLASPRFRAVARERAAWVALGLGLLFLAWLEVRIANETDFTDRLRPWIGASFQPGWSPGVPTRVGDRTFLLLPYWASPWNGVVVGLHLAFAAFVGAGEVALRRRRAAA